MFTIERAINGIRQPKRTWEWLHSHHYASPNLAPVPDAAVRCFPDRRQSRSWNKLVAHSQMFDRRFPWVGLVTEDESALLYNYAKKFAGQDLLEIGCWVGWSTVLLAMGGARVTVIDPVLSGAPQGESCRQAIQQAGLSGAVTFIGGFSPEAVTELNARGYKWSLCFIDGNHEGDAPLRDVQAAVHSAREDSLIIFHDVLRPNVAEALSWAGHEGWQVGVHHTCWMLGIAWRGSAQPLQHTPDPKVDWDAIIRKDRPHLAKFARI